MFLSDIVDKFLYKHSLSYASASKESDLSSLKIGFQKINDLDSGEKHLLRSREIFKFRRLPMNRECTFPVKLRHAVDRFAHNIHHSPTDLCTHRHSNRATCTSDLKPTPKSIRAIHSYSTYGILSDMLLNLDNEFLSILT